MKLLDTKSPTYLRRLVREINRNWQHGVYATAIDCLTNNRRLRRVRFSAPASIVGIFLGRYEGRINTDTIEDGYGRHICASRDA